MPCLQAGDCWRGGLAEDLPELVVRGFDALKGEEASHNWFKFTVGGLHQGYSVFSGPRMRRKGLERSFPCLVSMFTTASFSLQAGVHSISSSQGLSMLGQGVQFSSSVCLLTS